MSLFDAWNGDAFSILLHGFAAQISVNEEKTNSIDTCFCSVVKIAILSDARRARFSF